MVTNLWVGDALDPVLASDRDVFRAVMLVIGVASLTVAIACTVIRFGAPLLQT